jgi:hypothetical protein
MRTSMKTAILFVLLLSLVSCSSTPSHTDRKVASSSEVFCEYYRYDKVSGETNTEELNTEMVTGFVKSSDGMAYVRITQHGYLQLQLNDKVQEKKYAESGTELKLELFRMLGDSPFELTRGTSERSSRLSCRLN